MHLQNKLAIITGAANGIGKAIAIHCAMNGCKIALVDIDENGLNGFTTNLNQLFSNEIHSFVCDVSIESEIKKLVNDIKITFNTNSIQLLFNNVGLSALTTTILNGNLNNLHKIMNVNVWSIIYGTREFLPLLLNNDHSIQCYIVNTGSIASIYSSDSFYGVTKQTVLAISETIEKELKHIFRIKSRKNNKKIKCNILVTTLCPAFVNNTELMKSSANILKYSNYNELENEMNQKNAKSRTYPINSSMPNMNIFVAGGINPNDVVKYLFDGLKNGKTIIHTHIEWVKACIKDRTKSILEGKTNNHTLMNQTVAKFLKSKL